MTTKQIATKPEALRDGDLDRARGGATRTIRKPRRGELVGLDRLLPTIGSSRMD